MKRKLNLLLVGIDSLRSDHMSLHGYPRLTTPHIDRFVKQGTVFDNTFSPHIPTTPGYTSMFTGMDCFGMDVVALRHEGGLGNHLTTLAEILNREGYNSTCVGFSGNPASRGFKKYIDFEGWGSWEAGRSHKAENLNAVTIPELKSLASQKQPFFLFLRHMDPHSPYLPPRPFERMFYNKNELDPKNKSLKPVYDFKPFCDYFASWFPPGCTDKDYIIAQYDGAVAYMDSCIANIFATVQDLGIEDDTLVVITSDHGETLHDHDCYYDHHGLYDCTLRVPLAFVCPGKVSAGLRFQDTCQTKDITPTILDILGIKPRIAWDGRSLMSLVSGKGRMPEPEFYITECTWMRKHGWRTPEWKLIHALEPDFHFKPEIELYNLITDPEENHNLATREPDVVRMLEARMLAHIARREKETGRRDPIYTNLNWHGKGTGPFRSSEEAYNGMHIGSPKAAKGLQAKELKTQRGAKKL
ncbi:MAG: sulfatase [Lentisphaerae bacterium RIFOXYC12_FULL_60_16]|nr:MAG: sulfatase [Chloroflexi bacterium RIFOXYD12_FULL_57_15]OGV63683.1 MAG: sulfatase [Lentisphaerae bacterium RIFOXYC12_FULL_60_16]OGV69551.1 MAG: sulfatase [Lentisphaerae bacterium RIFOXYA12_FULL_60_10]OGV85884.1 MAG: sulfatase [Lentisphaerae bacterium RIFOXYB12_FULL_60_10]